MLMESALGMDMILEKKENEDQGGGLDQMVRLEVMRGCELVQEMEQKVKLVPMGCLSLQSYNENEMVRASLMGAAAAIVTSFSNVITLFNSTSSGLQIKGGDRPVGSILREDQLEEKKIDHSPRGNSSSPIRSSAKMWDSPTSDTPPPSPQSMEKLENLLHSSPTLCSTATPPQSPKNRTPSTKRSTPSPQHRIRDLAPVKSDGRADLPTLLDLNDTNGKKMISIQDRAILRTENLETDSEVQNSISKRRKCRPNWTVKIPGSNTSEQGNEVAPEDGYTWRKYGQKDILGSRHPRSYYRCTHKRELGCPAIKYVQKSDDDHNSPLFHVTYRGAHTCHSQNIYVSRSYPFSMIPTGPLQDLKSNLHVNSSCLTLSSNGSLQVGQCGPTFFTAKDFQLGSPFVSSPLLSKSTENELGKSLIFKPIPSFPLPEFAKTPRFGSENNFSSLQFQPKNFIAAVNSESCENSFLIDGFDPLKMMTISQPKTTQIKQTNNTMLTHSINMPISEADKTDNLARSDSTNISRDTRESFKQLINHLCLDDMDTYDSSADLDNSDCPPEHFSPTPSEVLSPPLPLESLQRSSPESKPLTALAAADLEDLQADAEPETLEEVAEHIPSCKFEVDFILDSPCSQQQLLDLQSLLFEP